MSREFLDQIPEHLRHIYDKPAEPNPQRMYFDTLKQKQELEDNARKNSVLYKIFGENLFGFLRIDKQLHLNINVVNVRELLRSISEEDGVLACMESELDRVGDDNVKAIVRINRGEKTDNEEVSFHFDAYSHSAHIGETRKNLKEVYGEIDAMFTSTTNYFGFPTHDQTYANQEKLEAFTAARRMLGGLNHHGNPMNHSSNQGHHMYFRHAIRLKPLARSIREVRKW